MDFLIFVAPPLLFPKLLKLQHSLEAPYLYYSKRSHCIHYSSHCIHCSSQCLSDYWLINQADMALSSEWLLHLWVPSTPLKSTAVTLTTTQHSRHTAWAKIKLCCVVLRVMMLWWVQLWRGEWLSVYPRTASGKLLGRQVNSNQWSASSQETHTDRTPDMDNKITRLHGSNFTDYTGERINKW